MAPKRGLSIERTSEYEDFMKELAVFHEKRGYVTDVFQMQRHMMLTKGHTSRDRAQDWH
jgi:hypothetical protein